MYHSYVHQQELLNLSKLVLVRQVGMSLELLELVVPIENQKSHIN